MGKLLATLEYVRVYIDNLLVITKISHDDHLDKLDQVFIRLHYARLKVDGAKLFFYAQETEYLGYILTRGGVKPQPKKGRQSLRSIRPIMLKNYNDSLVWYNTIGICGQSILKFWPLSLT
jgi:hypothetical protein